jgi:hypothetical protein
VLYGPLHTRDTVTFAGAAVASAVVSAAVVAVVAVVAIAAAAAAAAAAAVCWLRCCCCHTALECRGIAPWLAVFVVDLAIGLTKIACIHVVVAVAVGFVVAVSAAATGPTVK